MNMAQTFSAARPVAQHCDDLIRCGPRPEERAEHLSAWRREVSQGMADALASLFGGAKISATLAEPEVLKGSEVFERIGPVAANSLLRCGEDDRTMLLSMDHATAAGMTDCSFGGDGKPPDEPPLRLPRSAAMLFERIAGTMAQALASIAGSETSRGDVLARSESATRLRPFAADEEVSCFTLSLATGSGTDWTVLLAVPSDRLDGLMPGLDAGRIARRPRSLDLCAASEPFCDLPLPLEAVLGEIDLPLSRLDTLRAGDELPFAIGRELSLRTGDTFVARGTVGSWENRMAVRITALPAASANPATGNDALAARKTLIDREEKIVS